MITASCIFILLGTICILAGKAWSFGIRVGDRLSGTAVGTISQIVVGPPDREGISPGVHNYFYPIVAFYAGGILYKERYHKGSNPSAFHVGEKVKLHYDPEDPGIFEIQGHNRKQILSSLIYYLGILFCCIGGIFFLLFATRY